MNRRKRERSAARQLGAAAALLGGIAVSPLTRAAWDVVPEIELGVYTEDNPRMSSENFVVTETDGNSTSLQLNAGLDIATISERSLLRFFPSITSYRYADESNADLESDDPAFMGAAEYRWETVTAGVIARYARERLLDSEFATVEADNDPDTPDPDVGDTGRLIFIDENRERYAFSPYLAFNVSERNTFRLDVTRQEAKYSGGDLSFRTGYEDTFASASIIRNVDQRNSVSAIMSFEDYRADINDNSFKTATIEGAFTRPLTELWTFNFGVGVLRSDFVVVDALQRTEDGATTDYKARLGFRKRAERSRLNLDFSRNIYPGGSGYSTIRREARFYLDRRMTQRLTGRFRLLVQETETLAELSSVDNRDYVSGEIGFEWAFKPTIFIGGGFEYRAQEFTDDLVNDKTNGRAVYISMGYRGRSRR